MIDSAFGFVVRVLAEIDLRFASRRPSVPPLGVGEVRGLSLSRRLEDVFVARRRAGARLLIGGRGRKRVEGG